MAYFPAKISPVMVTDTAATNHDVISIAVKSDGSICILFVVETDYDLKSAISTDGGQTWTISTISTELQHYNTSFDLVRSAAVVVIQDQFSVAFPAQWLSGSSYRGVKYTQWNGSSWTTPEVAYSYFTASDLVLTTVNLVEIDGKPTIKYNGVLDDPSGDNRYGVIQKDGTWQDLDYASYVESYNFNYMGDAYAPIAGLGTDIHVVNYRNSSPQKLESYYYNGSTWSSAVDVIYGLYPSLNANSGGLGLAYYTGSALGYATSTDGSSWSTTTVDSDGDVGVYPVMLFDGNTPVIVYFDVDHSALKVAINDGGWRTMTFDLTIDGSANVTATIQSGVLHVAWMDGDSGSDIYHFSVPVRSHRAYPQTGIAKRVFPGQTFGLAPELRDLFVMTLLKRAPSSTRFYSHLPGVASVFNNFTSNLPGVASVFNNFISKLPGVSSVMLPVVSHLPGVSSVKAGFVSHLPGVSSVYGTFESNLPGVSSVLGHFESNLPGVHRVANDDKDRYELFIGIDSDPDFTADPDTTFTSLPHDVALDAPESGTVTYYIVTRKRNRYGVTSLNSQITRITIDSDGVIQSTPPRGPEVGSIQLIEVPSLKAQVTAQYNYAADGSDQADTWLIYITTDGSDPDPSTDTPTEVTMIKTEGSAQLVYTTDAQSLSTVVKALIRTRRTGEPLPGVDSTNTTISSLTISGSSLPAVTQTQAIMGAIAQIQPES